MPILTILWYRISYDLDIHILKKDMLSEDDYIVIGLFMIPVAVCVSIAMICIRRLNNLEVEEPLLPV
jgi:hypothetical protein